VLFAVGVPMYAEIHVPALYHNGTSTWSKTEKESSVEVQVIEMGESKLK